MTSGVVKDGEEQKPTDNSSEILLIAMQKLQDKITELENKQSAGQQPASGFTATDLEKIVGAIVKVNKKDENVDFQAGIYEEQIPADDFDKEGTRFCCPTVGHILVDDNRMGQRVVLPYKKPYIEFKYASTRKIYGQGKYASISPYSVYRSHSKKETEWIRNHSLYNVLFYESSNMAASSDALRMSRMATVMGMLKNYELPELVNMCKSYDTQPNFENVQAMRMNLAVKIVEKEEQQEADTTKNSLAKTLVEKEIIGLGK